MVIFISWSTPSIRPPFGLKDVQRIIRDYISIFVFIATFSAYSEMVYYHDTNMSVPRTYSQGCQLNSAWEAVLAHL